LRLCWILAVSTLFKQEYLLLDETINSLDQEAIGRVAELLDCFIKQREVIFYLVTHAQQIQEMPFWRRIIELEHLQKEE
jgi:ABC-type lipoprotein export system ATPase subunit